MSREKILPLLIILMILTSSFNLLELDYIKKDNSEKRDEDIVEKPQISPWIWTPDADITITIYEATDEKLKFTYSANLDLTGLVEYWGHGIYRIDVYIYATYGGVEIFDVFSNDFAYGSFLLGETLEVDRIKGISLGHLLDLGYENIRIRVHVHRQLNFIVIPVWDSNYIDTYIDLTDDDIKAPKFQYANYDLSKIMQSIGPYEITFEYRDDHPWEGEIECEFRDLATNNLRGTYNTIDKLQPNDENICNFQIPKSTWFLYPDSRIVFRTRAIDKDMDGGRTHDREQSEWEDWQNANKILSRVGGSIDSVQAYAYIDGWKLVSLSPTSSNTHFQSIYLYDNNYFTISILNPAGENLIILKASINFTCPLFDQPFRYYFPIDVNKPIQPGEIFSNSVRVKFDPDDLDMGNWDSPTMKLNFSFQFSMESNPSVVTSYKEIAEFQIIKAPEPTFKFIGFKTPFDESIEGERFTYKTRKTSTSIYSTFEICNNARIPINISQDFDFISGTNEYEIGRAHV